MTTDEKQNDLVLLARPSSGDDRSVWLVWCPHCRRDHQHGALAGYRVRHCAPRYGFRRGRLMVTRPGSLWDGYIIRLRPSGMSVAAIKAENARAAARWESLNEGVAVD